MIKRIPLLLLVISAFALGGCNTVQGLGKAFDSEWGGFGTAPKFPSTFNLELMLRAYMSNGGDAAKDIVTTTLIDGTVTSTVTASVPTVDDTITTNEDSS